MEELRAEFSSSYNAGPGRQMEGAVGNYQTRPLVEYENRYLEIAQQIMRVVNRRIPLSQVKEYKGSFSILGSSSQETVAKIVIFNPLHWKTDAEPFMREGVNIWVRCNGKAGAAVWDDIMPVEMPWIFRQMRRKQTMSVAPHYDAQFAYFPVMAGDDFEELADFLAACSRV